MTAYYNEFDPKAAAWLRELIRRGLIADGEVDERSILEVTAGDLRGFTQCHFFAGIGGWSYALRLAGVRDDTPVWTGSPPCQPFSAAGQQKGKADDRHLAPHFATLVADVRPAIIFGEQVASAAVFGKAAKGARKPVDGEPQWAWLDDLQDRLEAAHYACGFSDIPAAGVGAPHIRQRTFFGAVRLADADEGQRGWVADGEGRERDRTSGGWRQSDGEPERGDAGRRLADSDSQRRGGSEEFHAGGAADTRQRGADDGGRKSVGGLADADGKRVSARGPSKNRGASGEGEGIDGQRKRLRTDAGPSNGDVGTRPSPLNGHWRDADWLFCRDGKWRPVEPGTFPLAHGLPARVGRLRGYGNAIVPQVAALFITAFLEAIE